MQAAIWVIASFLVYITEIEIIVVNGEQLYPISGIDEVAVGFFFDTQHFLAAGIGPYIKIGRAHV